MSKCINFVKRLALFFIGMTIVQFGVALFIKTSIGSDPFTVFTQGLANGLNNIGLEATTGTANRIILVVLFAVIFLVEKNRIKIGTLICVVGVGPIIDMSVNIVSKLPIESYGYLIKLGLVVLGCFIIAVGFSILSSTNIGVAPNDIVPFIIQDKLKIEYRWIRIGIDATFLVVGFVLGGVVGIGTVISMLTTGPFIQVCLPYGEKIINFILNEEEIIEEVKCCTE
ncbi:YczE/YyaS/YitT family protein [Clostridium sp.]|uniref:YczE/YyaS/YitT family protein n=1 Tax=Clostridium sp. TaxID=1506 RepID=UPI003F2F7A65